MYGGSGLLQDFGSDQIGIVVYGAGDKRGVGDERRGVAWSRGRCGGASWLDCLDAFDVFLPPYGHVFMHVSVWDSGWNESDRTLMLQN